MILKSVQYRTYSYGDKIVEKDQKIDNIYFMSHHSHKKPEDICRGCLGLFETINNINGYVQTMVCQRKRLKIVYLPVSVFRNFALNGTGIEKFESVEMDKSIISLNKSFLAINGLEPPK